jgi:molybdopterin/thiamine biosynthesis adenylyltransferase
MSRNALDSITGRIKAVKIIGLGGIGAPVAQAIMQFLSARWVPGPVWLIDGDSYEERNRDRVLFEAYDNKAMAKAQELAHAVGSRVTLLPVPEYVTPRNVRRLIDAGDIVFLCVDNHATRKLVSNRCRRLRDVALFSGGNDGMAGGQEGTFGNVQVYVRQEGRDRTNPLTRFHPEISQPQDNRPDELGCAALVEAAPQLLFTNLAVAAAMLGAFYAWLHDTLSYEELYLDIALGRLTPVARRARHRTADPGTLL